jgi:hypothetical protein
MRAAIVALASAVALLCAAGAGAGAVPDDLSEDPLDRGTLLALPSLYRVDMTLRVEALRTRDGDRIALPPEAREIEERGSAFAVAPNGWLVTAAHVAAPDQETVARLAYQTKLALEGQAHSGDEVARWVEDEGARPVGARVVSLRVRQADAGEGGAGSRYFMPNRLIRSARADLALLHIDAPGAPALALDESASIGTPVASLGFGTEGAFAEPERGQLEPAVRRGELARTGLLEPDTPHQRQAVVVTIPLQPGDSGGPVIDADGDARGVAVIRTAEGGIAERATEVRQLLEEAGIEPATGRSAQLFRSAMASFWGLDLAAARRGLSATLDAYEDHTLAAREERRARALAAADFTLVGERRRQGFLLALGALAVAAALACGVGLARQGARGRGTLRAPTEGG